MSPVLQLWGRLPSNLLNQAKSLCALTDNCYSTPGDLIVLAASDAPSWSVNDGNVGVEALDTDIRINSFSHTRVYNVTAGAQTFYAVAHNYVESDGDGESINLWKSDG